MKRYIRSSSKLPTEGEIVDRSGRHVGSYYVSFTNNYSGYNYEFGGAWRNFRTADEMMKDIESRGYHIR